MASADALPFEGADISISSAIDFLEQRLGLITKSISKARSLREGRTLLRSLLNTTVLSWREICDVDEDVRLQLGSPKVEIRREAEALDQRLQVVLQNQARLSRQLVDNLDKYARLFPALEELISEARVVCQETIDAATPDEEFFKDVGELEQQAIDEHRAGRTVDYDCS